MEWERAARGADTRDYPMGSTLHAADANIDITYDKKPDAMGPDEVSSYPGSRSPFNVDDLVGNVNELMDSSLAPDETVARGGSYGYDALTSRIVNRNTIDATFRQADIGFRVCVPLP